MNPAEEIPPEVAHRAYYRQPVWKRIVVIAAGPAVNIVLAFVILLGALRRSAAPHAADHRGRAASPRLARRGASCSPATAILAVDGSAAAARRRCAAPDRARHQCAGKQTRRLHGARRPPCSRSSATARTVDAHGHAASTTRRPKRTAARLRVRRTQPTRPGRSSAAELSARHDVVRHHAARSATIAQIFKAEKRKEISGVVGTYEVTRQASSSDPARRCTLLAVISLSLGVINLFPFLPLDGGHIFWAWPRRCAGGAIPFGVMERAGVRRLRARDHAVRDRAHERHRPADRRGVQRPVAVAPHGDRRAAWIASAAQLQARRTIAEAFRLTRRATARTASRSARKDDEVALTWGELRERVDALAGGLAGARRAARRHASR